MLNITSSHHISFYMALIITPQYFRRTSRQEAVQTSLPEGRIPGTFPVGNIRDKGFSELRKPRVSTAGSDLRVKKISRNIPRVSRISMISTGISINSRVSRKESDSLCWLPEEQRKSHLKSKSSRQEEAVQTSLPEGRIPETFPVGNVRDNCFSDLTKPRVSTADSDSRVKKISSKM